MVAAVIGAVSGAISGSLAAFYLGERSKRRTHDLYEVYQPLREELMGIRKVAWDRLGMKGDYFWSQSETYRRIESRGSLLPRSFRDLKNDILHLERLNEVLMDKSRDLWKAIDASMDGVMRGALTDSPNAVDSLAVDDLEEKQLLKEHLKRPIYLGEKDEIVEFLDLQGKEWKHFGRIPFLKKVAPLARKKVEGSIAEKREEYIRSKQEFDDELDLILGGLNRSIESGGWRRYRRARRFDRPDR